MIIKLTNKAVGELVLSSINRSLRKGQPGLPINKDQYWNDDVQKALTLGFIEVEGEVPANVNEDVVLVYVRSLVDRTLVLPSIPGVLRLGQVVPVTTKVFHNTDIQQAIGLNIIEVIDPSAAVPPPSVTDLLSVLEGDDEEDLIVTRDSMDKPEEEDQPEPDEAELFKEKGQAQTIHKETPKDATYVPFDPRPAEEPSKGTKGGKKGIKAVGRVKTAGKTARDGETSADDDGIEMKMLSDGDKLKVE